MPRVDHRKTRQSMRENGRIYTALCYMELKRGAVSLPMRLLLSRANWLTFFFVFQNAASFSRS